MDLKPHDLLITGAGGFIGTALVSQVIERTDFTVACVDLDFGDHPHARNPRVTYLRGDVRDADSINAWVGSSGRVIHLAAVVGVDHYLQRPLEVLDVNILGTRNVLRSCLEWHRPVVLASTSETYGKNSAVLHEDSDRLYGKASSHRWSYAVSKAAGEHYAHALGDLGLRFLIARYFNVYGAGLDAPGTGRVVSRFLGCIRDKVPLTLVDGGDAVRSFCYVDDAVDATLRLCLALDRDLAFQGQSVNVGRAEPVTIAELAATMTRLSGHTAGTRHIPGASFFGAGFEDIPQRTPDLTRLRELLGFEARVGLEEGISRTLAHWNLLVPDGLRPAVGAPKISMVRPWFGPDGELLNAYDRCLASGQVTNNGPFVQQFEREIAHYLDVEDAVAVSSGSDALYLALRAADRTGKAILPSYTFIATLHAVLANGLEPVFCDIDEATFTLSAGCLEGVLEREDDVAVVIPVNVFGVAPDLATIAELTSPKGIEIVYDNAHGFGTEVFGVRAPYEPLAQVFSFHATKALPAIEGGAVVSRDADLMGEIRRLRNHGIRPAVVESSPGPNSKMDELRALTGLHGLRDFDRTLERRRHYGGRLSAFFNDSCAGTFRPQLVPKGVRSNYQNLGVVCGVEGPADLESIRADFLAHGIEARSYFNPALHHLAAFRATACLPTTDRIWRSLLCLPIHSYMSEADLERLETAACRVAEARKQRQAVLQATGKGDIVI